MPLPLPRLDDRRYSDLVADALAVIDRSCERWTDRSPGDPGVTLLEAFAFLTENMLYRFNRLPEKVYIALLNLIGVQLRPPSAAATDLVFTRTDDGGGDLTIPLGAQVATGDGSLTFIVTKQATLKQSVKSVSVSALHAEQVEGELVGSGTGAPAQFYRVQKPPIIAPSGDELDLVVGVEASQDDAAAGRVTRAFGSKAFVVWQPVDSFADATRDSLAYRVDRAAGLIQFAPAGGGVPLAAVPAAGREIRVWYRRGGGRSGNVAAGTLTALKSPALKVGVTNPTRASGGDDAESVSKAIERGPLELSSMRCAVTARDFERIALTGGGIARAHAFAQAQAWRHADAGVVGILLLPSVDVESLPEAGVTLPAIAARRSDSLRSRVEKLLDERRPLGVRIAIGWTNVRPIGVSAKVMVTRGEDPASTGTRLRRRLNALFSPYRDPAYGQVFRASDAYETLLAEPGVRYVDNLRFHVSEAPAKNINDLVCDPHQPRCWYAAADDALYRSLDDGDSWSIVFQAAGDSPQFVRRDPQRPGLLALGVKRTKGGAIHVSHDCGETWTTNAAVFDSEIFDAAWLVRTGLSFLLIATREGLFQVQLGAGTGPALVIIDKANDARGYYAVATSTSPSGIVSVAVAMRENHGVFLSPAGGVSETFHNVGLVEKDIRTLLVQHFNARDYLWAGARAEAGEQGEGAFRLELRASGVDDPDGWKPFNIGWQGGSCESVSYVDGTVYAGSNRAGVLLLDTTAASPSWRASRLDTGLPIRDKERLLDVTSSVAACRGGAKDRILAGGPSGVFRSTDGADHFLCCSVTEFSDRVPIPPNWLYCAGSHELEIVSDVNGGLAP